MAMHFLAFMSVRYIGQEMGGIECKLFIDEHRIECAAKVQNNRSCGYEVYHLLTDEHQRGCPNGQPLVD
jgi:hypothetical protein